MTGQGPMAKAVVKALREAAIPDRDAAAVQLVRRYAQLLDEARNTTDEAATYDALGPKLLAALTAIGLTLAGRAANKKGAGGAAGGTGSADLDRYRSRSADRRTH